LHSLRIDSFFTMWYRIFSRGDNALSPSAFLEHLHTRGLPVEAHFKGDDLGWTAGELRLGIGSPVYVERYLAKEDNLRDDLNSWAAFLETCDYSSNHASLMERVIQSAQMVTVRRPLDHSDDVRIDRLCIEICRYVAANSDGVYQIDDEGWFAADGTVLLKEY
jgi:hypothetical protein